MSLLDLSYAWLSMAPGVDSILLGPASVKQLEEGVAATSHGVPADVRGLVDALYRMWTGTDASYVR
jgi:aryl-alcohol dehydrogenase-like predicted oxidoreductase